MPRTTWDLIEELQERAEGLTAVSLAIGFEATTEFVFAHEAPAEALAKLNAAIARGGEPMGFIGFRQEAPGHGGVLIEPVAEHAEEEWVEKYLFTLVGEVKRSIERGTPGSPPSW